MLVIGTMAFDSIETPSGSVDRVLGGSGTFSAYAASFFTRPRLVSIVGNDFSEDSRQLLVKRGIDLTGVQVKADGKTFYWKGKYHQDMNTRDTMELELNVIEHFNPVVPKEFSDSSHIFLANCGPAEQMKLLDQVEKPELILADTMDFWIQSQHEPLLKLLKQIDGLLLNDGEARLLTGLDNLILAAKKVREMGPKFVIIKKGEHGSMLSTSDGIFMIPAFPTTDVIDPTGAGDSFAGALVGYMMSESGSHTGKLRRGMAYGTVLASLTVEGFGLDRLKMASREELDRRLEAYRNMLHF